MNRNCFVEAGTKKYDLQDGEWIEVIERLNTGQQRKQDSLALVPKMIDGKIHNIIDWAEYEILRAELWLVAWHIHDAQGNVPPCSLDSIKALDPKIFEEINNIIYRHAMESTATKKESSNPSGNDSTQISA